jgi:hypothetical protein
MIRQSWNRVWAQHCAPATRYFQRPTNLCRKRLTPSLVDVDGAVNLSRMN